MVVKVFIRDQWDERFEMNLCDTEEQLKNITVRELKRRIAERKEISERDICLIFDDRRLEDSRRLSHYGVRHKATIDMTQSMRLGAGGMGDREGRYSSMDRLVDFGCPQQ